MPQTLTPAQTEELVRLKGYFPFRIIFGVLYNSGEKSGEFQAFATRNKRMMNKLAREGHAVFQLK